MRKENLTYLFNYQLKKINFTKKINETFYLSIPIHLLIYGM